MKDVVRIGIIICHRYLNCAGGKCLEALRNREGAFNLYKNKEVELVGFTNCGGCPGGNIEYTPGEMEKYDVDVIHLATGLVVGYPPCSRIKHFIQYINTKFNIDVKIGTHPIPEKYYETHIRLGSWKSEFWQKNIKKISAKPKIRLKYN